VGVKIDETGSDKHSLSVDFLGASSGDLSDLGDVCAGDCHIGVAWFRACAVEDGAVADDEIETVIHGGCSVAIELMRRPGITQAPNAGKTTPSFPTSLE
jgi:hypothetical protein